ncbi:MAG TPA: hypothetical protein VN257_04220, partial [Actinotalea sp.]|nr:hypothetical protein [Actinotalea sp.]
MRIKLTLQRSERRATNLAVTADATATVGDVAASLFAGDPENKGRATPERLTLRVAETTPGAAGRSLDPASDLLTAGLRSGSTVSLVQVSSEFAAPGEGRGPAAAVL